MTVRLRCLLYEKGIRANMPKFNLRAALFDIHLDNRPNLMKERSRENPRTRQDGPSAVPVPVPAALMQGSGITLKR